MLTLGITGHRNLGGYNLPNPTYNKVCKETERLFKELNPDQIITGMALGFDIYSANIANKLNIPFIAAVPFKGQENLWLDLDKKRYHNLLSKAKEVIYVSPPGYAAYKMQVRNKYIVDNCDLLLACFNGEPKGGTYNCLQYAKLVKREIIIIDPNA